MIGDILRLIAGIALGCAAALGSGLVAGRFLSGPQDDPDEPAASPAFAWRDVAPAMVAVGLLGGYLAWRHQSLPVTILALVLTALCLAIAVVDLRLRRIPNALLVALAALALPQILLLGWPSLESALLGGLVGGGVFLLLYILGRGAMGAGDVKFIAASGLLVGYPLIVRSMLWGIFLGGAAALVLLLTRRAGRKDAMAYGPYLALGTWMVWIGRLLA